METFSEWLVEKMNERELSQAELARRAGTTTATISRLLGGRRNVGAEMCVSLARALQISADDVFRAAGLLPSKPSDDEVVSEIAHISHSLNQDNRQDLLDYARLRLQKQEKEQSGKRIDKRTKMPE